MSTEVIIKLYNDLDFLRETALNLLDTLQDGEFWEDARKLFNDYPQESAYNLINRGDFAEKLNLLFLALHPDSDIDEMQRQVYRDLMRQVTDIPALIALRDATLEPQEALEIALQHDSGAPDRVLWEFMCRCIERALSYANNPDSRSVEAFQTLRRWLDAKVTNSELAAALRAARNAFKDSAVSSENAWIALAVTSAIETIRSVNDDPERELDWSYEYDDTISSAASASLAAAGKSGEEALTEEHEWQRQTLLALLEEAMRSSASDRS